MHSGAALAGAVSDEEATLGDSRSAVLGDRPDQRATAGADQCQLTRYDHSLRVHPASFNLAMPFMQMWEPKPSVKP